MVKKKTEGNSARPYTVTFRYTQEEEGRLHVGARNEEDARDVAQQMLDMEPSAAETHPEVVSVEEYKKPVQFQPGNPSLN